MLRGGGDPEFQARIKQLGRDAEARLTVVAADGSVIADSEQNPSRMDNHAGRAEIAMAARQGMGYLARHSRTLGKEMVYLALPVAAQGRTIGFVRTSFSASVVDRRVSSVTQVIMIGAAFAATVALLLGLYFTRRVTSRLQAMRSVANSIVAGDHSQRVQEESADEIGDLARAFNVMAGQMEGRIGRIIEERNTVEAILGSMIEGVVAVDIDQVVIHMNEVAGEILGVDRQSVISRRVSDVARVREVSGNLSSCLQGRVTARTQIAVQRGEEECQLDVSTAPLYRADGATAGAVVVFQDVSEMRRLENVRQDFVANASHELKTPIAAIQGFLDTLVEDPEMSDDMRVKFLERASRQSDRLALLVTDLLRLSRVETSDDAAPSERIDLRSTARRSVSQLGNVAGEKRVRLSVALDDNEVPVMADPASLNLIVDNLVDNAIKYTGSGGFVVVRVHARGGEAVLEVKDDGIGIAQEDQARVFERFYRVDKARSREIGGTGLGLAIAKHACGLMGGQLTVESEPGVGSSFRVSLPLVGDA